MRSEPCADLKLELFIVSGQWPLARNVVSVARVNDDMTAHRLIARLFGIQYDADCGSLGVNGLLNQFRENVPGYTPASTVEEPVSRFSDYP